MFGKLAYELRTLIWSSTCPEPTPEVCISRNEALNISGDNVPSVPPLLVYTSYPALMHTCQEARKFVLQNNAIGRIKLVGNPRSGCLVAIRDFDPSIDTLYWPASQYMGFTDYILGQNGISPALEATVAKQLRHLAVEWGMMNSFPIRFVEYILESCPALESISVVFPHVPGKRTWTDRFPPPEQFSRLRRMEAEEQRHFELQLQNPAEVTWYMEPVPSLSTEPHFITADKFLESLIETLNTYGAVVVERMHQYNGRLWNLETKRFDGLAVVPKMFIEYRNGQWLSTIGEETAGEDSVDVTKNDIQKKAQRTMNKLSSSLKKTWCM